MEISIVADAAGPAAIQAMLDACCALNSLHLSSSPKTPPLYSSGVRYKRESAMCVEGIDACATGERFNTIPVVLRLRFGDCDDLACWRAAELRVRHGVEARPRLDVVAHHPTRYHVVVQLPDGTTEDPSAVLGMGSRT